MGTQLQSLKKDRETDRWSHQDGTGHVNVERTAGVVTLKLSLLEAKGCLDEKFVLSRLGTKITGERSVIPPQSIARRNQPLGFGNKREMNQM